MEKIVHVSRKVFGNANVDDNLIEKVIDVIFDYLDIEEVDDEQDPYCGSLYKYPKEEIAKVMFAIADELKERYSK